MRLSMKLGSKAVDLSYVLGRLSRDGGFSSRQLSFLSTSKDIFSNLLAEEALLRAALLRRATRDDASPSDSPSLCLFSYISDKCVVIGRNQNVYRECNVPAARREGIPIARRPSGGGAVYHDEGNVNFSFFTHRDNYDPARTIYVLMKFLCVVLGVEPRRLTTTGRHDIFLDGQKISGSAMRVQRDVAYHHCTLLVCSHRPNLGKLLKPSGNYVSFQTSAVDSVRSPVTTLREEGYWARIGGAAGEEFTYFARLAEALVLQCMFAKYFASFGLSDYWEYIPPPGPIDKSKHDMAVDRVIGHGLEEFAERKAAVAVMPEEREAMRDAALTASCDWKSFAVTNVIQPRECVQYVSPLDASSGVAVFVDAEGRKPPREGPHRLQEEYQKLRSSQWNFDSMPKFHSCVAIDSSVVFEFLNESRIPLPPHQSSSLPALLLPSSVTSSLISLDGINWVLHVAAEVEKGSLRSLSVKLHGTGEAGLTITVPWLSSLGTCLIENEPIETNLGLAMEHRCGSGLFEGLDRVSENGDEFVVTVTRSAGVEETSDGVTCCSVSCDDVKNHLTDPGLLKAILVVIAHELATMNGW